MAQIFGDLPLKRLNGGHVVRVIGAQVLVEHVERASPVRGLEDLLGEQVVGVCEGGPEGFDGGCGVDEGAVEVEEE